MNPRITSIENLIASDPGGRNMFALALADQLRLAAQSLRLAQRVAVVSGFYIPQAKAGETDGPPGAKVLGEALKRLSIEVDYLTDPQNAPLFRALGIAPLVMGEPSASVASLSEAIHEYLDKTHPTHLIAIERAGRAVDGRYRNMRGVDITDFTVPLDELFLEATRRGLTTLAIGDGGNEIGMGKVFCEAGTSPPIPPLPKGGQGGGAVPAREVRCIVPTDFCIVAGVSNWGAFGLTAALSVLAQRDLLPSANHVAHDLECIVEEGGAVDGVTLRREPTCDGQDISTTLRMLEQIRRHLTPSPLQRRSSLLVGILGYGKTGRAAARLLGQQGHRVHISDEGPVTLNPGTVPLQGGGVPAGVETGGHSVEFLAACDLVVASPGVPADHPVLGALYRRGIYVMSEMELAYQLGLSVPDAPCLIAVTGTVGKRTTVELLQKLFHGSGNPLQGDHVPLLIGGNRGRPLCDLLLESSNPRAIAVAVSSFQLESVVHFRPHIAVLLNIDEAHLDRHRCLAEYVRVKSRIFMNQGPGDALILPFDDQRLRTLARKHQGRTFFFSARQEVDRGAWLRDGCLRLNIDGEVEEIGPVRPLFPENLLSAVLAARIYGLTTEAIARVVTMNTKTL